MSHHNSLESNKKNFAELGKLYDSKKSIQVLTNLFAASLLTYNVDSPRKLLAETEEPLSDTKVAQLTRDLPLPHDLVRQLIKPTTSVVDFACGTGLVMEKIAPYMPQGKFVGVDISDAMLSQFDAKGKELSAKFPDLDVLSVCGDVLDPSFDTLALEKSADVLICTLAFHHLHEYGKVAEKLKSFVAPGGWILIYDFYNEDTELPLSAELVKRGVSRHGLSLDEMNGCFREGCTNVSSAREFKVTLWQEKAFVLSHCCLEITENLEKFPNDGDLYSVDCSVILGVAQVI